MSDLSLCLVAAALFLSGGCQLAGNKELSLELTKWVFRERGILRASKVHHQRADGYVHPSTANTTLIVVSPISPPP